MKRPIHSRLQNRLLLHLTRQRVTSISSLARSLGAHRSSVSRAAHALLARGLVAQTDGVWELTEAGQHEILELRTELPKRTNDALASVTRLAKDELALTNTPFAAASEREEGFDIYRTILADASRNATTSLLRSASLVSTTSKRPGHTSSLLQQSANIDLLQSMGGFLDTLRPKINSLMSAYVDTMPTFEQVVAKIDLTASVNASLKSIIDITAGNKLSDPFDTICSVVASGALRDLRLTHSAIDCIRPLVDSLSDIRSLAAQYEPWKVAQSVLDHQEISSLVGTMQPIVEAAARFDAISTLGRDSISADLSAWQSSVQSVMSAITQAHEPRLMSVLERVSALALKPSLSEVAVRNLATGAGLTNGVSVDQLCPNLVRETMVSLAHSHEITHGLIQETSLHLGQSYVDQMAAVLPKLESCLSGLRPNPLISNSLSDQSSLAEFACNAAAIARTYESLIAETARFLITEPPRPPLPDVWQFPALASATLVASLAATTSQSEGQMPVWDRQLPPIHPPYDGEVARLEGCFTRLGPQYVRMWHGGWAVLVSDSPDRIRQAAHSARELLSQTLAHLAPDMAFSKEEILIKGHEGKPTRKMRVRKILTGRGDSEVEWVEAIARSLDETYAKLSSVAHDHAPQFLLGIEDLRSMMLILGGLIDFIVRRKPH